MYPLIDKIRVSLQSLGFFWLSNLLFQVYVVLFTAAVAMWLAKGGQMSDFSLDSALRQLEISANMILNPQTEWQKEVNNRIIQDVRSSLWCAQSTEASAVEGCNVNRESRRRESIVLD
mmetsp:Transcript_34651/g.55763  ORF Transcript_34651/g.55763 Transcript_34651/m.55763 type:complete len:118 (-) Transcript_34651:188-541(-)